MAKAADLVQKRLEVEIKTLISRREHEFRSIQILYDISREVQKDKSKLSSFRARYKNIESLKESFYEINQTINLKHLEAGWSSEPDTKLLESFDELYYSVIEIAEVVLSTKMSDPQLMTIPSSSIENKPYQVRLPKLHVPIFDSNIINFQTFKDSYLPLIHNNNSLSDIEKFHYLISCLSGFALTIAKGVPLTASNYSVVFQALLDRYDNKRVLATAYLDKIFSLSPLHKVSIAGLNVLTNTLYESVNALRALNIELLDEVILFYLAARVLDGDTRQRFELQNKQEIPTFESLLTFLQNYIKILEVSNSSSSSHDYNIKSIRNKSEVYSPRNKQSKSSFVSSTNTNDKQNQQNNKLHCPCCDSSHSIYKCFKFQKMSVDARWQLINDIKLCSNCLRTGHNPSNCLSKINCFICGSRHNTFLHTDAPMCAPTTSTYLQVDTSSPSMSINDNHQNKESLQGDCINATLTSTVPPGNQSTKILGSAIIRIRDSYGNLHQACALIDSGSMDSFITSSCVHKLELPVRKCDMSVTGLGQNSVQCIKGVTYGSIMPKHCDEPCFQLPLIVIQKITSNIPVVPLPSDVREKFSHLYLANDNFDKPCKVDILLGVECFDRIYDGGRFAPDPEFPCALSSVFGWVITGQLRHTTVLTPSKYVTSLLTSTNRLDNVVQRFWETEEPPTTRIKVPEDDICEQQYKQYTYRDSDGRYVVPIMLKDNFPVLGNSSQLALNRFLNLEKRMSNDVGLKSEYVEFMRQYEELGHMDAWESSCEDRNYIIPHHCVVKPDSTTTRLRVVFDASCMTTNNKSLNDIVHVGPKLQIDIIDLITKFRLHPIVFTADICKMYRQILIRPEDRSYQHIFWRDEPNGPIKEYELNTVTYGVSSSPYLAIRTLHQLADDYSNQFPLAAQVLREETFMDDITSGAVSIEAAKQLKEELVTLLQLGKFELRKWSSNCLEILSDIPSEYCQSSKLFTEPNSEHTLKILGIKWDPLCDQFSYSFSNEFKVEYTKRSILSIIARIFDPLGWICPVVFSAKLLLQEMWRLKLMWDEPIPYSLAKQWHILAANLSDLQSIKLPRLVLPPDSSELHLVGFCDGSSKGYGCCVYLCAVTAQGTTTSLLIGKSKIAPLKPLTTNRLELCAAVLLARVLKHMYELLNPKLKFKSVKAFTDSSTVLSWLHTAPHLLKTFVANRVVLITDLINSELWFHVSTHDNPADCCSRGTTCTVLADHHLWWTGPSWLRQTPMNWPIQNIVANEQELPELKPLTVDCLVSGPPDNLLTNLISRVSSLSRLQRILAWCLRFIKNIKLRRDRRNSFPLSTSELNDALILLVKHVQIDYFSQELRLLQEGLYCTKSIQKLSPFLDEVGIIRVGGRIRHSNLPHTVKHPILLPKLSILSQLVVDSYHLKYLHCGPRTLQSLVCRTFWILGLRLLIRSRLSKCVICFKSKPFPCQPSMGDLPVERLQSGRCFQTTGIDFGGPFMLKESRRRNARTYKAWICLFICLSVKAVHLEVVTELSTEAFLAALDRFVSRRNICHKIISDCGTNFVGSNRYLNEMYKMFYENRRDISDGLAVRRIRWEFNPPGSPHFGGIFESGIKSTKYHLKRVVGAQVLTLEEMFTVVTKIEAVLNSRPLCALSSDPNEVDVLTPGHFLVGGPLISLPEIPLEDNTSNLRSRWLMLQKITQMFWRIWQIDYLHTLQQRNKWLKTKDNIKINDPVILMDSNLPPLSWKLAKIVQVHPGRDNVIRVVSVKTASGNILKRPVVKCKKCKLFVSMSKDDILSCKGLCGTVYHKKCANKQYKQTGLCEVCQRSESSPKFSTPKLNVDLQKTSAETLLSEVNKKLEVLYDMQKKIEDLTESVEFYADQYQKMQEFKETAEKKINALENKNIYLEKVNEALEERVLLLEEKQVERNIEIVGVEDMEKEDTKKQIPENQDIIIVGDMNINLMENSLIGEKYKNMLCDSGLQSAINECTREEIVGGRLVSSCIDHVWVRSRHRIAAHMLTCKISDHYMIGVNLETGIGCSEPCNNKQKVTPVHIEKIISKLNSRKSPGADGIRVIDLKMWNAAPLPVYDGGAPEEDEESTLDHQRPTAAPDHLRQVFLVFLAWFNRINRNSRQTSIKGGR
ncbi:uncharacterized protein LOC131843606 [Achroia grisella]|uniref:uncharacterized protein LOC131843606 n=1 Tax=Achroia grisella TaxID=688607 RepID=UPI0027D31876|nr:uncharacterized protein LOC131843606 [Achroia grisella]